jgi:hypothetical protein
MAHPLGLFIACLFVVFVVIVVVWNFVPKFRAVMKGYSTVAETGIGAAAWILGQITGAIQDAQAAGYLPPQLLAYLPAVFLLWFLLKRFVTDTPVGQK